MSSSTSRLSAYAFHLLWLPLVAGPVSLPAQEAQPARPATTAHGAISGTVVDSLRGGLLAGAMIAPEGLPRVGITDSLGRFFIDSVPPGDYRLSVMDALLDTLNLQVMSQPLTVIAGDTSRIFFGLPSPETVVYVKCGAGPYPLGQSVLLGMVVSAETEEQVAGADVVLAWSDLQASAETGVRRLPRQRSTKTDADGTFRICGLPSDVSAELVAWKDRDTTAVIPFAFSHPRLALQTVVLPAGSDEIVMETPEAGAPPVAEAPPQERPAPLRRGRSVLRGQVTTLGGSAIEGARVSVAGAAGLAITDASGEFVLAEQPSGSQTAVVRRLGYQPAEFAVNLSPQRATDIAVQLPEFVPVLATVVVRGRMDVELDRLGFTMRSRGAVGRFMKLEDIERRNAQYLVDLLAEFPMLRAVSTGGRGRVITGRSRGLAGGCVAYWVDGFPWLGGDSPGEFILPGEVAAIEVYSAGTTPPQFQRAFQACEAVVIWTKHKVGLL